MDILNEWMKFLFQTGKLKEQKQDSNTDKPVGEKYLNISKKRRGKKYYLTESYPSLF